MLLSISHLSKSFSGIPVIPDLSLEVNEGERVAIVGRNGAGKTTLLRILATFLPATSGSVQIDGCDLFTQSREIRKIIGYLPENAALDHTLCPDSFLRYRAALRGIKKREARRRIHEIISFCDIAPFRNIPLGKLSAGQRKAVGLADAMLHEPRILLLDDPIASADPFQTQKITQLLTAPQVSEDRAILFSTHSAELIRAAATRVVCMENGKILADTADLSALDLSSLPQLFRTWQRAQTESGDAVHE